MQNLALFGTFYDDRCEGEDAPRAGRPEKPSTSIGQTQSLEGFDDFVGMHFLVELPCGPAEEADHIEVAIKIELPGTPEKDQGPLCFPRAFACEGRHLLGERGILRVVAGQSAEHLDHLYQMESVELAKSFCLLKNGRKLRPNGGNSSGVSRDHRLAQPHLEQ